MDRARESGQTDVELRAERIREVKHRLRAGVYETEAIRDELAERLTGILGDLAHGQKRSIGG